jgi:hypothetical protein
VKTSGATVAAAMMLAACVAPTQPVTVNAKPAVVVLPSNPQVALFRDQIARVAPPGSEYAAICISNQGFRPPSDPAPALVALLSDVRPPVRPWSACRWTDERPIDIASGRPAIQIAHSISCSDVTHCAGTGGYAYGNMAAASFNYSMEWRSGHWVISALITAVS